MLIVTDGATLLVVTGAGDVLEPEHDVAAIGSILIPAMKKEGYSAAYSAAVTTASTREWASPARYVLGWLHEQDIRDAVDRPGDESGLAVEVTLDELRRRRHLCWSPSYRRPRARRDRRCPPLPRRGRPGFAQH